MTKVYLSGSESINNEVKEFMSGKAEFTENIESAGIIINSTNFPEYEKTEELQYIEANSAKNIPIFTSSLCSSVSAQSSLQENPERLIGIGLYDTFSIAKRIEIAPSKITDDKILKNAENFLSEAGINYSIVPDRVGLIFPRIVSMIINEAVQVFSELIASKEDIDTAMKLGTNYPFGPLEWADRLGIELVCNILAGLQRDFGEDRYRPHPLLKEMIDLKKSFY
ncbi:MAG: 3-hydroxybutyryl-CoA dehydrogenase [Ignavibacteria bacterium]|nr:3-hydroxybutyryl-CoA dehydrogenase [Ignavibacteria bacterium]